ncbi:Type 2 glycosyltransferase [Paramyrothecium foliicola]|nr:Type 2 glycosyltransferase [Paramyrothecium foliicola]
MALAIPSIRRETIDEKLLREIYDADQGIYPAPLDFERLQSWAKTCPELSICFRGPLIEGNASIGAIIVLPILKEYWDQLLEGRLKEIEVDASTMLATADESDVGLHVFHVERFQGFTSVAKSRRFSDFALETVRAIAQQRNWKIHGFSALTATSAGRAAFKRMGFRPTGYEEVFVRVKEEVSGMESIQMQCIYVGHQSKSSLAMSTQKSVLASSQMVVRDGNENFVYRNVTSSSTPVSRKQVISALVSTWLITRDNWLLMYWTLYILRYTRFYGHCYGYFIYEAAPIELRPRFTRRDVTVILPTIDPNGPDFHGCIRSILANRVAKILVVTVGPSLRSECRRVLEALVPEAGDTALAVSSIAKPSKRRQIAHAIPHINTYITVLADDHVFWPSLNFIPSVLAPFEDDAVGVVATKKRVIRTTPGSWSWKSLVNFIACNYLERHNSELRASNAIDGGVFVVSGRTAVYRTEFLADQALLDDFCNEKFFFGLFGGNQGLGPDDDNFLTRNAMKKGWLIRFQDTEDATVETTLGDWPKFNGQLLRWARTTFRSNPVMLRDADFLKRYSWSAAMVYLASLTNFAIVWDAAMFFALVKLHPFIGMRAVALTLHAITILLCKSAKVLPHFSRHPSDMHLFVVQVVFGYLHSFYKLWALLTFWDCDWSGRNLEDVGVDGDDQADNFENIN